MAKKATETLHTKGRVPEVVTCGLVIIGHAEEYLTELVIERPLWTDLYFTTLKGRLTGFLGSMVGEDRSLLQREQTAVVKKLDQQAKDRLSSFKIQTEEDFRKNKPRLAEIFTTLGFNSFFKGAITKGESNLVSLLERFKTNMLVDLQDEIIAAGGNVANITAIMTLAGAVPAANVIQEGLKGAKKKVTEDKVIDFNDAYDEVMSVCKVATNIFKKDPVKRQLFSYAHTLSILRGGTPAKVVPTTTEETIATDDEPKVASDESVVTPVEPIVEPNNPPTI